MPGWLIQTALGQASVDRLAADESLGVASLGAAQRALAVFERGLRPAVVDGFGGLHGEAGVPVVHVVRREEGPARGDRRVLVGEAAWKAGMVLERLELGLGVGVVVADPGRPRYGFTPRRASSWAMPWLVMAAPRSECRVRTEGSTPCLRQVSSMSLWATPEFSRSATIQPTAQRLKRSSRT